ncbi:MAG: hypothetical protein FJY73_14405 [Candidatus Eisenbacteria bacterium]|nr:hypothetical protein [Candidatus Eisenbacteria bacterium]
MAYTYEELAAKNVTELREIAKGIDHEAVHGHSTMHKEPLVKAICAALGIDTRAHHRVVGINKADVKAKIRALRAKRDEALRARDSKQLKFVRRRIHHLKRMIHKATV